jgi:hypothetical protein
LWTQILFGVADDHLEGAFGRDYRCFRPASSIKLTMWCHRTATSRFPALVCNRTISIALPAAAEPKISIMD